MCVCARVCVYLPSLPHVNVYVHANVCDTRNLMYIHVYAHIYACHGRRRDRLASKTTDRLATSLTLAQ